MAHTTVTTYIFQTLNICSHFSAQIAFDYILRFSDTFTNSLYIFF